MKLACISDLHGGQLPDVETSDLVLLGGDLCPGGTFLNQLVWLNSIFRDWLEKLLRRNIPVVGICGNHDEIFSQEPEMVPSLPWVYLQDNFTTFEGFRIWGSPWSSLYGKWSFMGDEKFLASRFHLIPEGTDIIIAHGPPYGYGDLCPRGHEGSRSLLETIERVNPRLVVCGHFHEARGIHKHKNTIICNAASWDHHKDIFRPPMYIHLD